MWKKNNFELENESECLKSAVYLSQLSKGLLVIIVKVIKCDSMKIQKCESVKEWKVKVNV